MSSRTDGCSSSYSMLPSCSPCRRCGGSSGVRPRRGNEKISTTHDRSGCALLCWDHSDGALIKQESRSLRKLTNRLGRHLNAWVIRGQNNPVVPEMRKLLASWLRFGIPWEILYRGTNYLIFRIAMHKPLPYPWLLFLKTDVVLMFSISTIWWVFWREIASRKQKISGTD